MTRLTVSERIRIIRAAVLAQSYGDCLSHFERRLIGEIDDRARLFRMEAVVSDQEWAVVDAAIAAMLILRGRRRSALAEAMGLPADVTIGEALELLSPRGVGARLINAPEPTAAGRFGRTPTHPAARKTLNV